MVCIINIPLPTISAGYMKVSKTLNANQLIKPHVTEVSLSLSLVSPDLVTTKLPKEHKRHKSTKHQPNIHLHPSPTSPLPPQISHRPFLQSQPPPKNISQPLSSLHFIHPRPTTYPPIIPTYPPPLKSPPLKSPTPNPTTPTQRTKARTEPTSHYPPSKILLHQTTINYYIDTATYPTKNTNPMPRP